tara:strand:- start:183 stop:581 length:399 start_codon:yes stop_codon:yes gene_type:complete
MREPWPEKTLGKHMLLEFHECDFDKLDDESYISVVLNEAAKIAQATILNSSFHRFQPQGVSGVVMIAESHISIHTWPEHLYAAVDLFSCSEDLLMNRAKDYLIRAFGASSVEENSFYRGNVPKKESLGIEKK